MAGLPALRPVAAIAALNATVQGLLGVVLGVVTLCICFCALGTAPQAQTNNFAQYVTYYFQGEECRTQDYGLYSGLTSPTALRIWMALSLFFSASMMVSSVVLVLAVLRQWSDEKLQITLVSWLFINTFTAADDVILGYVFGNDFLTALDSTSKQNSEGSLTLGIVTFISLRGVYLWFLNVALIFYLYRGAQALHKYLNEQISETSDQDPIESWPTLDDFGKNKSVLDIDRTERPPTAVNPRLTDRMDNGQASMYPEHSAMARWPTINGQAQTMRDRSDREREMVRDDRERRARTVREPSFKRQEGVDNPNFEGEKFYLRLQSDTGSTRDYDEAQTVPRSNSRSRSNRDRDRETDSGEQPRRQGRSKREVRGDEAFGLYKQKTPDPWRESIPPPPSPIRYMQENSVHIPPVDYNLPPEEFNVPIPPPDYFGDADQPDSPSSPQSDRPQSLHEAILDRTLRLKKVPDSLKRGLKY